MTPLVVIEGSDGAYADAVADLRSAGWTIVPTWNARSGAVCNGVVTSGEDAAAALLAAVGGAGVLIHARAERDIVDRLCEGLRRLGRLDHRVGERERRVRLTREEQALAGILLVANRSGQCTQAEPRAPHG